MLSVGHFANLEGLGRRRFAVFYDFGSHLIKSISHELKDCLLHLKLVLTFESGHRTDSTIA